ncbi:hypothetical protein KAFR_0J02650 [Kazachstania africana CBS 2517]|uniref:Actin-binding protein n=1 Tax=Kazachstania africana (strain ATCC 22294 / BCRC 22015 / CBS 2517 / CECT 1963 / NBRC 1671 / NRRL Y-8276) TaxID=1071382 RepID=H2B129_KAZAF|nr:hypothetical protein KAFR_0J02650 [Kazachstania africana CBS 2517]CCF60329.1 hypothetical protein KAFR_0J02650 [Kazachstania africana CBS 2517]
MALEPINCDSHSRDIEQAYLKVVRGDDDQTKWLILSPNASKEYFPESTGSDFTEFLASFDDTKVQYGMARVSPPGSDVEKLILIGWCPDSAPMKTRASFAANFGTVANNILKGYHIQVTARDEDDLDEKELLMKVSNAAGARYSIQKSASAPTKPKISSPPPVKRSIPTPVVAPKRTVPQSNEEDDWGEPEIKERDFNKQPLSANQSTYKPIGKIDLQKVIAEETAKEDPRLVHAEASGSKINPKDDIASLKNQSKLQRDNEINSFLKGTKPPVLGNEYKRNDDNVIKGFKTEKTPAQLWAEKKAKQSATTESTQVEEPAKSYSAAGEEEEREDEEQEDVNDLKSKFETLSTEPTIISPKPFSKPPVQEAERQPVKTDYTKIGTRLPGMHQEVSDHEEEQQNEDDWNDEEEEAAAPSLPSRKQEIEPEEEEQEEPPTPSLPSRTNVDEEEEQEEQEEEEPAPSLPTRDYDEPQQETRAIPPPPPRRATEQKEEQPWAIAEYDYEAGEDNELTFEENDKIINIEFVDDDWWLGELEKNGEKGLFPSNYVNLGNQ